MEELNFQKTLNQLTEPRREEQVLRLFLDGNNDRQIAETLYMSPETVRTNISNTCRRFGLSSGNNNREELIRLFSIHKPQWVALSLSGREIELPHGSVPLNSRFYIPREQIEFECSQNIQNPGAGRGALIRIKAPKLMGKTSLVSRIIQQVKQKEQIRTVEINFAQAPQEILHDSDKLLKWFCFIVGKKLNLENQLNKFWNHKAGDSIFNCSDYFKKYLLPDPDSLSPLILVLDNVDILFPCQAARNFFKLLRELHEESKSTPILEKLRLIIVHSTEVYVELDAADSPFANVGYYTDKFPEFTKEEVKSLFILHELSGWKNSQIDQLMEMVSGHPYLIRLALYHWKTKSQPSLEQLLEKAATPEGIYSKHLRILLAEIRQKEALVKAYQKVIRNSEGVVLDPMHTFLLDSLGLVNKKDYKVVPRCRLYREYFLNVL